MCVFGFLIGLFTLICVTDQYVETKKELTKYQQQQIVEQKK